MISFIKKFPSRIIDIQYLPLILLVICFLPYGLIVPLLGFYWDDFPYVWFYHFGGITGINTPLFIFTKIFE